MALNLTLHKIYLSLKLCIGVLLNVVGFSQHIVWVLKRCLPHVFRPTKSIRTSQYSNNIALALI
jgi:hypothetical protein